MILCVSFSSLHVPYVAEDLKFTKYFTCIITFDPYNNFVRETQRIQMTCLRSQSELGKIRFQPLRIFVLINDRFYVSLSVPLKHCPFSCFGDITCAISFA